MKVKGTILGSKHEERIYRSLEEKWGHKFKVLSQTPLAMIVQPDPNELRPEEMDYFYKTNLDFTICTKGLSPLLSLEFDGMGKGYSKGGIYIRCKRVRDPRREIKLNFKLRIAEKADYPLIIISFDEIKTLYKEDTSSILDCIVGQILAKKDFERTLERYSREYSSEINGLVGSAKDEFIQNMIISAEVISEMENDPIAVTASEYQKKCSDLDRYSWTVSWLSDPPLFDEKNIINADGELVLKPEALENIKRVGCRILYKSQKVHIERTVWVRNIECKWISPDRVARNIAEYLVFKEAYKLLAENIDQ